MYFLYIQICGGLMLCIVLHNKLVGCHFGDNLLFLDEFIYMSYRMIQ